MKAEGLVHVHNILTNLGDTKRRFVPRYIGCGSEALRKIKACLVEGNLLDEGIFPLCGLTLLEIDTAYLKGDENGVLVPENKGGEVLLRAMAMARDMRQKEVRVLNK